MRASVFYNCKRYLIDRDVNHFTSPNNYRTRLARPLVSYQLICYGTYFLNRFASLRFLSMNACNL